jgi:hypothetical protein
MCVWKLEMILDDGSNVMSSTPYTAMTNSEISLQLPSIMSPCHFTSHSELIITKKMAVMSHKVYISSVQPNINA